MAAGQEGPAGGHGDGCGDSVGPALSDSLGTVPSGSGLDPLCSPQRPLQPPAAVALTREPSPSPLPAAEPLLRSRPPSLSTLVPLAEVAGGGPVSTAAAASGGGEAAAPTPALPPPPDDCDEHDDSSCGMDDPARADQEAVDAGYESSDDMDFMNTRHCINCTGELWGSVCRACGYMDGHEASIFDPVVAPPLRSGLLRGEGSTVISYDDRMLLHDENMLPLHPERADRIRAVMARLNAAQLTGRCRRLPSREATPQEVERCHIPDLMNAINVLSERSRLQGNEVQHWPTSDTYVNQHTALCARLSAGACVDVAVAVARGEAASGVAIVRPPGHHAESNTAMGFCFFNNAGIAARAAQAAGARRVIILDWDVHHGNGTQHIFEGDSSVMYISLHRYDGGQFYPGTGGVTEVGHPGAEGCTVNVPWPCGGMRNGDYMAAFQHLVLPVAHEFAPDLLIISAGFDAAEGDPIGGCCLTPEVYAHMTAMLQNVAPTVLLLEGGYNLMSVAKSTEACVRVLLGERPPPLPAHQHASEAGMATVALAMRVQARYWRSLRGLLARLVPLPAPALASGPGAQPLGRSGGEEEAEGDHDHDHEADTDTPHVHFARGAAQFAPEGSGWESDLDPHSGASLGESRSPRGGGGSHAAQAPQQQPVLQPEGSDTAMGSDDEEEEEEDSQPRSSGGEDEAEVQLLQHANSGQLLGQLSPAFHAAAVDAASPDLLPLQAGGGVRSGGWEAGSPGGPQQVPQPRPQQQQQQQGAEGSGRENEGRSPSGPAAHNWRKLALKAVALKRQSSHKASRLSPQLLREALSRD